MFNLHFPARQTVKRLFLYTGMGLLLSAGVAWWWLFSDLPHPTAVEQQTHVPTLRITDRHGRLLYDIVDDRSGRHRPLPLDQIPAVVRQATIATEDRNFYQHPGVDIMGILRALRLNWQGGEVIAGGSTITQQLARNLLLTVEERTERTVTRKLREAYLAFRLDRTYTKDEILALYINQIYYGGLAYGVEAAAQTYFGIPADELTLAQTAVLAGLPQSPGGYNPFVDPEAAKARQEVVLDLMLKDGHITARQHSQALAEPLAYTAAPYPVEAPHFVSMVQAQLDGLMAADERLQNVAGGFTVQTTLDLDWQHTAENIIRDQISRLNEPTDRAYSHNVSNGALVSLDPRTGDVLTLVGSPDFFNDGISGAINMALTPRQPGSTLKPMVYAAAMDPSRPQPYTAATMLADVRTTFTTKEGESYVPVNFSRTEHGPVLLRQALAASLNIPAVATLDHIGVEAGLALMEDMGIHTFEPPQTYDLSFALGGGEVRLFDLTTAYAAFANGGHRLEPRLILAVTTADGESIYMAEAPTLTRVLSPQTAWLITDILSDNDARQMSFGPNSVLQIGRPAAAKTGTTNDFHDNWTVGYTPQTVTGVWVGNANNTPMVDVTGISGAGPIWHTFMRSVHTGLPAQTFSRPDGLIQADVCALSGKLPTPVCPYRRSEWFAAGTQPQERDTFYQRVKIDTETGLLATATTPGERAKNRLAVDLPSAFHPWAREQNLLLMTDLEVKTADYIRAQTAAEAPPTGRLVLVAPTPRATYRLSEQIPTDSQKLPIEAVSDRPLSRLTIHVDGRDWATLTEPPYTTFWPLTLGEHQVWATAETSAGEILSTAPITFTVRLPEPRFPESMDGDR